MHLDVDSVILSDPYRNFAQAQVSVHYAQVVQVLQSVHDWNKQSGSPCFVKPEIIFAPRLKKVLKQGLFWLPRNIVDVFIVFKVIDEAQSFICLRCNLESIKLLLCSLQYLLWCFFRDSLEYKFLSGDPMDDGFYFYSFRLTLKAPDATFFERSVLICPMCKALSCEDVLSSLDHAFIGHKEQFLIATSSHFLQGKSVMTL